MLQTANLTPNLEKLITEKIQVLSDLCGKDSGDETVKEEDCCYPNLKSYHKKVTTKWKKLENQKVN